MARCALNFSSTAVATERRQNFCTFYTRGPFLPHLNFLRQSIAPMFSAAFIWEPGTYDAEFNELNALIEAAATSTPGFLGVEEWTSPDGKRRNATYYWDSLDSLRALSTHPKHLEAKRRYSQWYNGYHVVISEVVKSYGDGAFGHFTQAR
jgi:heme-degrading monooxygenase HmoA